MNRSLSFLIFFFYFSDFIWFMRKIVFMFGFYSAFCCRWDKEERKRVRKKEKGWKEKKVIFYSTGYYFKVEYCLELLQWLLQYSPYLESYCSKSKKKNGVAESLGRRFWGEQWFIWPKFGDAYIAGDALSLQTHKFCWQTNTKKPLQQPLHL